MVPKVVVTFNDFELHHGTRFPVFLVNFVALKLYPSYTAENVAQKIVSGNIWYSQEIAEKQFVRGTQIWQQKFDLCYTAISKTAELSSRLLKCY